MKIPPGELDARHLHYPVRYFEEELDTTKPLDSLKLAGCSQVLRLKFWRVTVALFLQENFSQVSLQNKTVLIKNLAGLCRVDHAAFAVRSSMGKRSGRWPRAFPAATTTSSTSEGGQGPAATWSEGGQGPSEEGAGSGDQTTRTTRSLLECGEQLARRILEALAEVQKLDEGVCAQKLAGMAGAPAVEEKQHSGVDTSKSPKGGTHQSQAGGGFFSSLFGRSVPKTSSTGLAPRSDQIPHLVAVPRELEQDLFELMLFHFRSFDAQTLFRICLRRLFFPPSDSGYGSEPGFCLKSLALEIVRILLLAGEEIQHDVDWKWLPKNRNSLDAVDLGKNFFDFEAFMPKMIQR